MNEIKGKIPFKSDKKAHFSKRALFVFQEMNLNF